MRNLLILISATVLLLALSCRKDLLETSGTSLELSTDSVFFDTTFTSLGSTTRYIKIYNRSERKLNISSIRIPAGKASQFRMNVDGVAGQSFDNVEINPKDSLYIFVEVTIDPNGGTSPLIVADSILFESNGHRQKIDLVAWGQDAYYYFPKKGSAFVLPCDDIWENDKPHVIFGDAFVDSLCTLTIKEGTKVYLYSNANLVIYREASLKVQGTKDKPVIFQGSRLSYEYKDVPGQWGQILLYRGSKDNDIDHAEIRNGTIGIFVDSINGNGNPTLTIKNTMVVNMSFASLYAYSSFVKAENCVFADGASYSLGLAKGGDYSFYHCTIANYWKHGYRKTPALAMSNFITDNAKRTHLNDLKQALFYNCIIYGNQDNEIGYGFKGGADSTFLFDHCLLKIDYRYKTNDGINYQSIMKNLATDTTLFKDEDIGKYELHRLSPVVDKGSTTILIPFDIIGNPRNGIPDLGAYEQKL